MARLSERQLEDFVCEYPEYAFGEGVEIIGRQVRVDHGIIDILAYNGGTEFEPSVMIIELKVKPLREGDVGQVLRYKHDVNVAVQSIGAFSPLVTAEEPLPIKYNIQSAAFDENWKTMHALGGDCERSIIPILVGPFVDKKVMAACYGAGIDVYEWDYTDEGLSIEPAGHPSWPTGPDTWWALKLHERIIKTCLKESKWAFDCYVNSFFGIKNEW